MTEEGEGKLLLEQIRQISQDLLKSLRDIDKELEGVEDSVNTNNAMDRQDLMNRINSIRITIGSMEKEDMQELEEEEILENMMEKLDKLIKMTLG